MTPRRHPSTVRALCAACLLGCLAGCSPSGVVVREQVIRTGEALVFPGPFAPKAMRIHPLTHAEVDESGQARVVLHVELKDAWGDTVKGVGRVQAQLWRDGRPAESATRWDVDLRDLNDNADFHDPATRTYRIVLVGLPEWLDGAILHDAPGTARMRVLFLTAGVDGVPVVLRDETVVLP